MCWHGDIPVPRGFESEMDKCPRWGISTGQAVQLGSSLPVSALGDHLGLGPWAPNVLWAWGVWGKLPLFAAGSGSITSVTICDTSRCFLSKGGSLESDENSNIINIWCSTGSYSSTQNRGNFWPLFSPNCQKWQEWHSLQDFVTYWRLAPKHITQTCFLPVLFPHHRAFISQCLCPSISVPALPIFVFSISLFGARKMNLHTKPHSSFRWPEVIQGFEKQP